MKKSRLKLIIVSFAIFSQSASAVEAITIKQKSIPVIVQEETIILSEPQSKEIASLNTYYFTANEVPYVCFKQDKKGATRLYRYSLRVSNTKAQKVYCTTDVTQFNIIEPTA